MKGNAGGRGGGTDSGALTVSTGDPVRLLATGRWDIAAASRLDRALRDALALPPVRRVTLDLSAMTALDTSGAWLIRRARERLEERGGALTLAGVPESFAPLLREVDKLDTRQPPADASPTGLLAFLERLGRSTTDVGKEAREMVGFFGFLLVSLARVLVQPRRLRGVSVAYHMEQTGLNALPIVGLLSFLIGIVLAYQGAAQLRQFGAEIFVVDLLGIAVLRELGILIAAIIIAGRSGSAFTAQIGTMKVNQEVDAMRTLGLDPVDILVLPRVVALCLTLPLVTFFANAMGILGGAVMSYMVLDITPAQFVTQFRLSIDIDHFWVGMVKAPVFAFTIAMVGCYQGLQVGGSAESVGRLTTKSVVEAIFLVIVLDAIFSVVFAVLGI